MALVALALVLVSAGAAAAFAGAFLTTNPSFVIFLRPAVTSLNSEPARKDGTDVFFSFTGSPVAPLVPEPGGMDTQVVSSHPHPPRWGGGVGMAMVPA